MSKSQPFQINWLASAGSALGAVSSAVLLSTLGAAGTLFGAALGSLIITVGGSIYTQSLQKTQARVSKSKPESSAARDPGSVEVQAGRTGSTTSPEPPRESGEITSKGLPWKRIVGLAAGLFVVAMAIILVFELSTGRPVSSYTGGTSDTDTGNTFSDLGSSSDDPDDPDADATEEEAEDTDQSTEDEPKKDEPAEDKPVDEKPVEEQPADPPPAADPDE